MSKTNVLIYTNVGKSQIEETDTHFKISGIPVTKNNSVMNRVGYLEQHNAKGIPTMIDQPVTLRHPEVDGVNVSAKQGKGLTYFSGTLIEQQPYLTNGSWKVDLQVNKKKLAAQDDGDRWTEILSNKETFGVSTGLTFTRNNESGEINGEEYDMVAMNQQYDHLAFLDPKVEAPAGGEDTMVRFNANVEQGEIIVCNIDDTHPSILGKPCKDKRSRITKAWNAAKKLAGINALSHDDIRRQLNDEINNDQQRDRYKWVVEVYDSYFIYIDDSDDGNYYQMSYDIDSDDSAMLSGEAQKVVKKFVKANAFAPATDKGYNSQEFDVNQQNEDLIMDRSEMLEALGLATNSQVTDVELKTLMKSKLAANASEGFTKEDVQTIVNAAIKPLSDQLTANADKELNEVAEQVAALNKGLDAEDAKALGLTKAKAFLAANGAEFVAEGYNAQHNGRTSASNKKDDGFDGVDLNAGLGE